jgi:Fic family protein
LDREKVRSSIARRLGLETASLLPVDRQIEGIVDVLMDATGRYAEPLTINRLYSWHGAMFPTGYSGLLPITVGHWRTDREGPMQIVSGPYGREKVHYVAPAASRLEHEMEMFLKWFEATDQFDLVLKAALSYGSLLSIRLTMVTAE